MSAQAATSLDNEQVDILVKKTADGADVEYLPSLESGYADAMPVLSHGFCCLPGLERLLVVKNRVEID